MKKVLLVTLLGASVNAFAGGSAWDPNHVNPQECVTVVGGSSTSSGVATYNTSDHVCMQGMEEGRVRGVNFEGFFVYGDGSKSSFSGIVYPGNDLDLGQDMAKTNKLGAKLFGVSYTWAR